MPIRDAYTDIGRELINSVTSPTTDQAEPNGTNTNQSYHSVNYRHIGVSPDIGLVTNLNWAISLPPGQNYVPPIKKPKNVFQASKQVSHFIFLASPVKLQISSKKRISIQIKVSSKLDFLILWLR